MLKPFIRLFSFFGKEVNEVRRQPRLVLSLLLGPFLILLLFGIGYQGERPQLRTILVVPPNGLGQVNLDELKSAISANFDLVAVETDSNRAMERLRAGQVEVVEILPADVEQRVLSGAQSPVEFQYNEVNPLNEQWIQYLAYAQVNEINKALLLETTRGMQGEAAQTRQLLGEVRERLDTIETGLSAAQKQETQQSLRRLKEALGVLAASPLLASQTTAEGVNPAQTQQQLLQLRADLDAIDQAISSGTLDQQRDRVASARQRIVELERSTDTLSKLPPNVLISPLHPSYQNVYGRSLDFMTFYAPSVVALILQHIAVTLGALSLVRERLLGAVELFRVAPVSSLQILIGKYLGYTLFIGMIAAVLVGLMLALGVPFLGSIPLFIGMVLLLTVASLGIGFAISAWSTSDSQAVQLSMLVLLLSIFFSGFFLALENFWPPIRAVGYALPLTHGIVGLQSIMLRGRPPGDFYWVMLGVIAAITFVAVALMAHWRLKRIS